MKKTLLLLLCSICLTTGYAQIAAKYGKGAVPVINGRVLFQDTITVHKKASEAYKVLTNWVDTRFVKPNVIVSKVITNDTINHQLNLTAEEWLVFKNTFLVLDRTRINYWMNFECQGNQCIIKMGRIHYKYEEERDGGMRFSAEEMITDENALNSKGTKMRREPGKFRRKTIDLFETIVNTLTQELQ